MKSLKTILQESLRIEINDSPEMLQPKTWSELRQIIEDRYEDLGPGTKSEPIDFNDINISKITTFCNKLTNQGLFQYTKFEYIDVSDWDVSNIENMYSMFFLCKNLISIGDISNWNVSNIKSMRYMFYCCYELEYIGDLSDWDVSNVENMDSMFKDSAIKNIPSWYKE